ncbi:MAG: adenine phosphoribosyltransferase [Brumimicrobium sp.]|nr:adenine phosphoribosyltransferase [Brumimicrobium sp.]
MMDIENKIKKVIRDVPNFPKEGIIFKDITPVMMDPILSNEILDYLFDSYKGKGISKIAGIESRGFLFGYPLAMRLGVPFILLRKEGKLPYEKVRFSYQLEYGSATIEMHTDAVNENDNILIHDDLLATGGSAAAAASLIREQGANIHGFNFLINLSFLNGYQNLNKFSKNILTLATY